MDPTYVRDSPGKSPMGMDLVPECPSGGEAVAEGVVRIDPAVVQSIGVKTARVQCRDLTRTIRTVGRVEYDERLVAHVHTKVQGWVEKLYIEYEGQMVVAGQPLLEIYSPELVSTQEELLIAARYRDETSQSDFADVHEGGESLLEATRRRLELWDIPDRDIERLLVTGEIRKTLTLYAPSAGVVTHMMVRGGMEVGPNDNLYTIADFHGSGYMPTSTSTSCPGSLRATAGSSSSAIFPERLSRAGSPTSTRLSIPGRAPLASASSSPIRKAS
jgi:Cu(I)/Ag(I) efflux system membrane fusion protein/cobalt-zinc-cadmium efflux system membrane fusion protein